MAKPQETTEDVITLPESRRHIEKGLAFSKKDYEDLLVMSNEALKKSKKQEKDPVVISELWGIYYNAFAGLIRSGILCSRQMGTDGFPEIHVIVNDRTYKVRESILVGIFREESEYVIKPWKDESASYVEDRPFKILTISEDGDVEKTGSDITQEKKKKGLFGRNRDKDKFTPLEMDDISSPSIEDDDGSSTEAFISIEMKSRQKKDAGSKQVMQAGSSFTSEEEQKLRAEYEAKLKKSEAKNSQLEGQIEKHKKAYKTLKLRSDREKAEAQKYTYDPNYDHYYSEELPQLIKSLEFSHSDMMIKFFCAIISCIGIAVSFIFMI